MTDSKELRQLNASIDQQKVGEIAIDALYEILPHIEDANTAEIMMAFTVMIKSTLIGMDLSDQEKHQAKILLDSLWDQVLADQMAGFTGVNAAIH